MESVSPNRGFETIISFMPLISGHILPFPFRWHLLSATGGFKFLLDPVCDLRALPGHTHDDYGGKHDDQQQRNNHFSYFIVIGNDRDAAGNKEKRHVVKQKPGDPMNLRFLKYPGAQQNEQDGHAEDIAGNGQMRDRGDQFSRDAYAKKNAAFNQNIHKLNP